MPYASYGPDKNAKYVDAFSNQWDDLKSYIFCPFSLMGHVLQKLRTDQAEAVTVAPIWSTQPWFPLLLQMICQQSYLLPNKIDLLVLPTEPNRKHPLRKMRLGVFHVSGKQFEKRGLSEETKKILMSSWRESTKKQYRSYQKKWMSFCYERNLDILKRALCGGQSLVYSLRHRNPTKRYLEIR